MLKGDKKKLERTSTSQINNNLSIKKKNDYDHKIFLKPMCPQRYFKKKKKGKEKKRKTSFATIGGNFLLLKVLI